MKNVNLTLRVDRTLKEQAEELFEDLGLSMSAAYTIFLKQAIREQQIPFVISRRVPNATTLNAIAAAEAGDDMHGPFDSVASLMEALNA